ncbi:hypothetical protein DEQ92_21215 [Haloferax sp. Atlit-6N]|uniref:helix-turn-helix domain-containing protein n=1 Tax=Haloferacaceae TaxID=1644056 RepID=UPI000E22CA3B|nr:helix-turn-helix transcriptional regulator [Halobellus sp. Atlit-38R]RDZ97815.1 hypothetical protein DEQ92_21215 [Haloferax sp. Atlit-6N]RLM83694.1 XRE family transcriptional regulator [Halobellus sp. Atlit-38R]
MSQSQHPGSHEADHEDVLCQPNEFDVPSPRQLRAMRYLSDLTIRQVADRADISTDSVWRWEQGVQSPRLCDVRSLLQIYQDEAEEQTQLKL